MLKEVYYPFNRNKQLIKELIRTNIRKRKQNHKK